MLCGRNTVYPSQGKGVPDASGGRKGILPDPERDPA